MARFTKNSKGVYRTGVTVGYDEHGNAKRKFITAKTITELEKKIAELKYAVKDGRNLVEEDILFGKYASLWFKTFKANRSINTRRMYSDIIERYLSPLFPIKVKDIKPMQLQALINASASHTRTCEQIKLVARQIFKQAITDGIIVRNPADSLELPRRIKQERRAFTEEEKNAIKKADFTERERALVMIAYGCGLRPAEIYALTWEDIDFKHSIIHITKSLVFEGNRPQVSVPKTNHSIRDLETPQIVMNALREYRATNISPILFSDKHGEYKSKTAYSDEWHRIKKKIEAVLGHETDISLYHFRHNYCTELCYSGVSLKEAQRLLGHSSYEMIMKIYFHLDSVKEDTARKLNNIIV